MIRSLKNILTNNTTFKKYFGNNDRGTFRNRRLFYTVISSLGAKGVNIFTSLLSVPLTYNYLNAERFGVMMTIVSLVASLGFADLGLGFGLQNRWAELSLDETGLKLKKAISSVFFFLLGVAVLLIVVGILVYSFIDISPIFKSNSSDIFFKKEVNLSALTFFLFTAISFPFSIVQKIQTGKQEGYYTNIWSIFSNIIGLVLLVTFTKLKFGIPAIIFALYGVTNIFIVLNFIFEFKFNQKNLRPKYSLFNFKMLKFLIKDGLVFLVNQIGAMVLTTSNNLYLANFQGAAVVGIYNIGLKLTTLLLIPVDASMPYLLPSINDAISNNDVSWLKKILLKYLKVLTLYSILVFMLISFFGEFLLHLWLNKKHILNQTELFSFGIFTGFFVYVYYVSYIMLSSKFIFFKLKIYPVSVLIATTIKYFSVQKYSIEGVLYTQSIVLTIFFIIPSFIKLKQSKYL